MSGEKGTNKRRHPCRLLGVLQQGREGAKDVEETGGALVTFPVTGPSSACVFPELCPALENRSDEGEGGSRVPGLGSRFLEDKVE